VARLGRPERRAELFEDAERRLERLLCQCLALRPPLDLSLGEQRPAELERHRQALVLDQRAFERLEGLGRPTARSLEKTAAAGAGLPPEVGVDRGAVRLRAG